MKITCQSCQSKYTVSDEKVQGKTVKIKCRKCGATILVNSSGVVSGGAGGEHAPAPAATESSPSYTVNVADGDQRTMTVAEIVAACQSSLINPDTYVWADGMTDWLPISQVEALSAALSDAPVPVADSGLLGSAAEMGVSAADTPDRAPVSGGPQDDPVPALAALAAASAPVPEPMFPAGVEPVVEPRAAMRRDVPRRADDLFAPSRVEAPMRNGAASLAATTTARAQGGKTEENSMLFSLSALTAKVLEPRPASVPPKSAPKDDSGMIDLKALAATTPAQTATPDIAPAILPEGGLFAAPVTSAPVTSTMPLADLGPTPKSKSSLFIALGAAAAVVVIVGVFLLTRGGPEKSPVTAAPAPTAEVAPPTSAAAEPAPTAVVAAVAPATPAPTASAAPPETPVVSKSRAPSGPARTSGSRPAAGNAGTPTPPPKTEEKKAPARGSCGCASSDLLCQMKCSTK